jgi:hypothetical protein
MGSRLGKGLGLLRFVPVLAVWVQWGQVAQLLLRRRQCGGGGDGGDQGEGEGGEGAAAALAARGEGGVVVKVGSPEQRGTADVCERARKQLL